MTFTMQNALDLVTDCLKLAERVGDAAIATHTDLGGLGAMFLAEAEGSAEGRQADASGGLRSPASATTRRP